MFWYMLSLMNGTNGAATSASVLSAVKSVMYAASLSAVMSLPQ